MAVPRRRNTKHCSHARFTEGQRHIYNREKESTQGAEHFVLCCVVLCCVVLCCVVLCCVVLCCVVLCVVLCCVLCVVLLISRAARLCAHNNTGGSGLLRLWTLLRRDGHGRGGSYEVPIT